MKKFFAIMTMMLIAASVSAQRYGYRGISSSVYRMQAFNTQMRINSILSQNNKGGNSESDLSFMKHFIAFGIGVGGGSINPTGNRTHSSFDMDIIAMNVLMSVKFGSLIDTGEFTFSDASSLQFGILFPVFTFDKNEFGLFDGQKKGKIFVAPLIGFIDGDDTTIDGEYMHKNTRYHHCTWWVDTSTSESNSCTEYGAAILVKHGFGYLMGKFTNKSFGLSVGLAF
jgi:hypothetical protein